MTTAFSEADHASLRARLSTLLRPGFRTRFAPAPTGRLHMGHAVNAVHVWSIARAFGGSVLLRIEDHDRRRARDAFDRAIVDDLTWLGLHADNASLGFAPVLRQSDDASRYQSALDALHDGGLVYACRCSRRTVADANDAPGAERRYPGTCRDLQVAFTDTAARRVRLAETQIPFDDLRHGALVQLPWAQCGDLLVRDRDGQWTYQHAVVVDDAAQAIDLIIRGDDLLPSTGRQLQLAALLGRTVPPRVLHHPLVTHPDGAKLSKSRGDTGLMELRDAGWSAARILGHAAWLGGLQPAARELGADDLAALWR